MSDSHHAGAALGADAHLPEDLPHRVLDHLLEGCQVIGPDWRYLYVNDAVVAQARKSGSELLGRTMMDAYPGIEQTAMFAVPRRCMEHRTPQRMENEFAFPDGSRGCFELRFGLGRSCRPCRMRGLT